MPRRTIRGKRGIITGASSGIGWALALELARNGARLIVTARRAERCAKLVDEIRATGGEAHVRVTHLPAIADAGLQLTRASSRAIPCREVGDRGPRRGAEVTLGVRRHADQAGARPLGRWQTTNDALRAWVFNAQPDGQAREVLVAWAATGTHSLRLPAAPQAVFDHLGRSRARRPDLELGSAPVYAVLAPGSAAPLALTPPPPPPAWSQGEAAPVVLQAVWPKEKLDLARSAYRVQESVKIPIYLYNFGERILAGALAAAAPAGWKAILVDKLELAPMQRQECALEVDCRDAASRPVDAVRITAQFGPGAPAVLSLRLAPEP
jgi:hypothetical protein